MTFGLTVLGLLLVPCADTITVQQVPSQQSLVNPGFEATLPLDGWEIITYGASADVAIDTKDVLDGRQALRVTAIQGSDTALGQEVNVQPGSWYRFTGWIKTRDLQPLDASVIGTFQVQRSRGRDQLASGPNHLGDTDWTSVVLVFQAPPDGRVRIAPFLAGYGKGQGTAWFDGLNLERIDPAESPIVITRQRLAAGKINPMQYGQFIEYLCNLVPGMWAEMLDDGSFEGLTPYKVAFLKETDFHEHPWYPTAATNRATFTRDLTTKVHGESSYKIAVTGNVPCTVGIAQNGLAVRRGVICNFSCSLRSIGIRGLVSVRLQRDDLEFAACDLSLASDSAWHKQSGRLIPSDTNDRVTLTIQFHGPGTLWLDNASLVPEDAMDGWRRDVVKAVRALKPGVIRFGGSALDDSNLGEFDWRDSVGDLEKRRPFRAGAVFNRRDQDWRRL